MCEYVCVSVSVSLSSLSLSRSRAPAAFLSRALSGSLSLALSLSCARPQPCSLPDLRELPLQPLRLVPSSSRTFGVELAKVTEARTGRASAASWSCRGSHPDGMREELWNRCSAEPVSGVGIMTV